jgi:hypothetical protein
VIRRRRLGAAIAAVVVAAAAAGVAAPARSQTQAELCTPGDTGSTPAGDVASPVQDSRFAATTVDVSGEFHYERDFLGRPSGDTVVRAVIVACGENQVLPEGVDWSKTEAGPSVTFSWKTPELLWNGPYAARVDVQSPAGRRIVTRAFAIVVPPLPPAEVRATQAGEGVTVSWAKNPEPDVVGYLVQRAEPSGAFQQISNGVVPATKGVARPSFVDHPPAGDWRYNVVALRQGAKKGEGLASNPSAATSVTYTPPTPTTTDGGDGGVGQGPATTAQAQGSNQAIAKAGKVDLSNFASLLDQRARAAARAARPVEPDPGFQEALPFQPGDEPALADGDQEAGAGQTQGEGQRLVSDDSDRRRAIGSLAAALLLFVMFMGVRWVRTELDEADLEAATPGEPEPPAAPPAPPAATADPPGEPPQPEDLAPPPLASGSDAPHLDVPFRTRRRRELGNVATETAPRSARAGRATRRVPPRPADDRGQGPASVRPRRRRAGGGDGRVPVR